MSEASAHVTEVTTWTDLPASDVLAVAVNQASEAVMVTLPSGVIIYVNAAFERMTGYTAEEAVGQTPRILKSGKQDSLFYAEYWRHMLAGNPWSGRIVNRRKDGSLYVEEHTATPVLNALRQVQYLISVGRDVTDAERTLRLLEAVTRIIEQAPDAGAALEGTLREVCEVTNWSLGEAWIPDQEGSAILCKHAWAEAEDLVAFQRTSRSLRLLPGQGLPGRAWLNRRPEWQPDVSKLEFTEFPRVRAAREAGLHAAFAVPIVAGNEVFAVLMFLVGESRGEDTQLVKVVSAMAAQLGQLFQRKSAEMETARLAAIVESSVDAVIGLDADGFVTAWNSGARDLYGWTRGQMIGASIQRIVPPERRAEQEGLLANALAGMPTSGIETTRVARDGRLLTVIFTVFPVYDHRGKVIGAASMARDVTEQRAAERALREQEYALREAQRVARVGSWHWIAENDEMVWSDEFKRIVGHPLDAPMPDLQERLDFYLPESSARLDAARLAALTYGTSYALDLERRLPDGSILALMVRGEPVRNDAGEIIGLRGTIQDITERKRVEAELLQAQKLDSIGRLAGGVAHDFNNLLTAIQGFTQLAIAALPAGHPVIADLEEVVAGVTRGSVLTQQLLTFARQQPISARVIDVNAVLPDIERLLRRLLGEDMELTIRLAPAPARIFMDRGHLEQMLVNFAVNARDAMPTGGELTYAVRRVDAPGQPPAIHIRVTDTGTGIPEDVLPHIFEPFFTTKEQGKGTGLGLSTSYGVVKQAGGDIKVTSTPGLGTIFEVSIPMAPDEF